MKKLLLLLTFAAYASAGSIWNYSFSDTFCSNCGVVGFTFSKSAPISISAGETFVLDGSYLGSCQTVNPTFQCQQINMYWRNDGQLQVNLFLKSSVYPNDWEPPIETHFAVSALDVEGTWVNSFSVEPWGVETQIFSIVDPESAPEPNSALLAFAPVVGVLYFARRCRRS
jgi:hypothetical protein